ANGSPSPVTADVIFFARRLPPFLDVLDFVKKHAV
ncbi:unnamed protein product, partial [Urochloa humidicola]